MQHDTREAHGAHRLRVVLDTNVYVSAFTHPEGKLFPLWEKAKAGAYVLLVSPAILREIARTLRNDFGWEETAIVRRLRRIARMAILVAPKTIPDAIPADPDDNHIIACALEGQADLIVSGDRHLLTIREYAGIPVVRPMDFLRTLGI